MFLVACGTYYNYKGLKAYFCFHKMTPLKTIKNEM